MRPSDRHATACTHSTRVRGSRGASTVEAVLLVGLIGLLGATGLKLFAGSVSGKATAQAERILTLEPAPAGSVELDHGAFPDPGSAALPLEAALVLTTTAVTPAHVLKGGLEFHHAYETWHALVEGFKDTSLERRWGANGREKDPAVPKQARQALDAAVASLDPARDADLVARGKEIRQRVDKLAGEAQTGTPSDGGNTGLNKISGVWGPVGDLVGLETRLYPSVTKWREAVRQVEKDTTDYLGQVKERNAKRRADDQLADFKKTLTDQRKDLADKSKRLPTMKADELQTELEKALTIAFLKDALSPAIPGRRMGPDEWKTANETAQREAAARSKELVAKRPDDVRRYLEAHYATTIRALDQMISFDPNAKPPPAMVRRP